MPALSKYEIYVIFLECPPWPTRWHFSSKTQQCHPLLSFRWRALLPSAPVSKSISIDNLTYNHFKNFRKPLRVVNQICLWQYCDGKTLSRQKPFTQASRKHTAKNSLVCEQGQAAWIAALQLNASSNCRILGEKVKILASLPFNSCECSTS